MDDLSRLSLDQLVAERLDISPAEVTAQDTIEFCVASDFLYPLNGIYCLTYFENIEFKSKFTSKDKQRYLERCEKLRLKEWSDWIQKETK